MLPQLAFFGSIAFSVIAWALVAARYIWPALHVRPRSEALRPLLILHSFRFLGMAFLVPGVVSPECHRPLAWAVGRDLLHSHADRAAAAHHARPRVPGSSAPSTGARDGAEP